MIGLASETKIPLAVAAAETPPARGGNKTLILTPFNLIANGAKAPDGTRVKLKASGTIKAECDYLVREVDVGAWSGQRVELNAMTSGQLVSFVERKLSEAGVAKLVPGGEALASAYRHTWRIAAAQDAVDQALALAAGAPSGVPPVGLERQIAAAIEGTGKSWHEALWDIVRERRAEVGGGTRP